MKLQVRLFAIYDEKLNQVQELVNLLFVGPASNFHLDVPLRHQCSPPYVGARIFYNIVEELLLY